MKIGKILYISAMILGAGLLAAGCSKSEIDPSAANGYITFDLGISGATRADDKKDGEDSHNENTFKTLDVFFYAQNATDDTPALLHVNQSAEKVSTGYQVKIAVNNLTNPASGTGLTAGTNYKVYAVANCAEREKLTALPSLNTLKAVTTTTDEFRSATAPSSFVMTNFGQPQTLTFSESEDKTSTLTFKRVAAKIRVAISVEEKLTDEDDKKWTPDLKNMRLFISNGVRTARLDGDVSKLKLKGDPDPTKPDNSGDYYHILTHGSTETDDYKFARLFSSPEERLEEMDADYPYYNDLPLYTYPNKWSDGVTESYQTMLTIVVPWENKSTDSDGDGDDDATTTYRPTYYRVPVTSGGEIVSNAYYYLRAHIGMLGSVTPEKPMEVDVECEIAPWVDADATVADIRPVRYLIFSQDKFEMHNTNSITIPFVSTNECIVSFKGQFYSYYGAKGTQITNTFDDTMTRGKGVFYDYSIDNKNKTLTFTHDFFSYWDVDTDRNNKVSSVTKGTTENTTSHRLFSPFDVYLTVSHKDNPVYSTTVHLIIYPAIYLTIDNIDSYGRNSNDGWIMLNGYAGVNNDSTGGLSDYGHTIGDSDVGSLTILTVTQLNEEEKQKWVIDDPRTYYINNTLSNTSMQDDYQDNTSVWKYGSVNGAFDGSTSTWSKGTCKTMWEYYPDVEDVDWSEGTWNALEDNKGRTLNYYYPASEQSDKGDIIAPKIIMASYHSYCGLVTHETARRRCAAFQQYGYPAGRWRLPTLAEIAILKLMQRYHITRNIFFSDNSSNTSGTGTNWCNMGATGNGITFGGTYDDRDRENTSYVRCVYDLWYWEKEDAKGNSTARIPEGTNKENWKIFTWGDRPKENPLDPTNPVTRGGISYTIDDYLQEHSAGNYAVIRDGENVRLEKMDDNE